jgi:hypothetical protein
MAYPAPINVEFAQAKIQTALAFEAATVRLPATGIFVPRRTVTNPDLHTGTNEPSEYATSEGTVYDFRLTMPFMPRFTPIFLESLMGTVAPVTVDTAGRRRDYATSLMSAKQRLSFELWDGNTAWKAWNVCVFSGRFTGRRPGFVNTEFTGTALNLDTLTSMTSLTLAQDTIVESYMASLRIGAAGTTPDSATLVDNYLTEFDFTIGNGGVYDWNLNNNENPAAVLYTRFAVGATYNGYEPSSRFQWTEFAAKTRQVIQVDNPNGVSFGAVPTFEGVKFNVCGFWNAWEPNQITQGRGIRLGMFPRKDATVGYSASVSVMNQTAALT